MSSPIHYREATSGDVPEMARCRLSDPAAGPADQRMAAYLGGRHHPQQALAPRVACLARVDGAVVGYIAGHLTRRFGCDGELQYLFVAPSYRGTEVAGELLRFLARWFTRQGAVRICVNVEPSNAAARAFYARHGATQLSAPWFVWSDIAVVHDGST
ncbi:MAG TPA: GNAT family N-acetyltransferase [Gemmatimonadales bacterium]|nr:GNAT family N-acetyltransferase [Gemmatimonadales bacterium]